MENFFANLVKMRMPVILLFFLAIVGGVQSFLSLPIDAFPDLANNQVQILTDAPGMAPLETEQLVTIPIESIMNGLPGVTQVRSMTKFGLSVVSVVFKDNVDMYFARQLVFERLQSSRSRLPAGINPELGPVATAMGEIYHYVVTGDAYSLRDRKTLQDWNIKYQLRSIPGIAEVNTFGGQTQEYVVTVSPAKLQQYKITLKEVFEALKNNNTNFGAGIIAHEAEQYTVRGLGRVNSLRDIGNIVIKSVDGVPICIRNVATVDYGTALRQGVVTQDGNGEVVTGIVMMLKGDNSRAVIERVKQRIQEIQKTLPTGISIQSFYDQSELVEQTMHTLSTNLIEGGALVIVVLLVMLGNIRAALIVALTIPISMMFSFMGMKAMGITANIMSLGAVDFGMIVDGSIVMVENSLRKLTHRENPAQTNFEIIQDSVREVARPILFGVLIITVVYMPILALEGMEYKMFSPMVFTVCFALLGSLATALILVPVLCSLLLRGEVKEWDSFILKAVRQPYLGLLDLSLRHKFLTVLIACAALVWALCLIPFLGTEFVPRLEEGNIIIETRNLPSISLAQAAQVSTQIEKAIKDRPEISTVVSRSGRPDLATDPMSIYQTDVYVILNPQNKWRQGMTKEKLINELRETLNEQIPGASFNFTQLIAMRVDELVSGVRSAVAVKVFGEDLDVLKAKGAEIEQILSKVRGQKDLQVEALTGTGQLLITPDRERLARYGVSIEDIQKVLQTAVIGISASEVLEGRKRFDLKVKLPSAVNDAPNLIQNILVETSDGRRLPLSQVAKVEINQGIDVVNREFAQRRIVVQCNVQDRDIGSFVKEAQEKLAASLKLDPGYYIQWGGQFENQERAMKKLGIVVPLSILIIFLFLTATFSSIKDALLVLLNVPFALIGGVFALWIRGLYLSVPASIGFIALFGVAVLNGLVLISYINKLITEGIEPYEAVRKGCETRLRPVLMTALVASLGFLPMAMSTGPGAEVQKPLATVVIGGIFSSTLLTLFVLPVLFTWLSGKKAPKQVLQAGLAILVLLFGSAANAAGNSNANLGTRSGHVIAALDTPLLPPIETPLSIDQALNETLINSPRAMSIRLQLAIAKSALVRAKQLPNPTIFMDNGYKAEFTYRYGVSIPIEPPWKLALRVLSAKGQIRLADLEISKSLWDLRGDIRRAYAAALIAGERYNVLSELADLYQNLVRVAEKRFKNGDVAKVDVFRAELAHDQAIVNTELMSKSVTQEKQSLNVLMGRPHDFALTMPKLPAFILKAEKQDFLPTVDKPLPELVSLIRSAKQNRLEVKIVAQTIRNNNAKLRTSIGNIVPTPVLGVGSSVVNGPPNPGQRTNYHGFFLQAFAEIPVFNFQQGDLSLYRMTGQQLRAELATQENIVEQDVVRAYRKLEGLRGKIHAFQTRLLSRSEEIARITRKSYEIGESDIASVLFAQQANVQVQNEYLDAIAAYQTAYTDLEQSVGTPLD